MSANVRAIAAEIMHRQREQTVKKSKDCYESFALTELGNAERFVNQHGDNVRYCHEWNAWLTWDGKKWTRDASGDAVRLAKATVRSIYAEASECVEQKQRAAIGDWAKRSEKASQIAAMLKLAQAETGVPISPNDFDRDAHLLNVPNGTIDLTTGYLRPHNRQDFLTKMAPVAYDPEAISPTWTRFLEQVFEPHPDLIPFVRRAIGYSLTGDTREECLFLLYGTGRNGKGTLIKTVSAVLGDYALTADFSTFVATRDDRGPRDDVANMHGRRFVCAQESREGAALAESLIKWLTGGDRVRARRLYENSWEFDPVHKLWLATNHKPSIRGNDPAIWSRIRLIPFDLSFEGREDRTLKHALQNELRGVLTWAVQGCLEWQRDGLAVSKTVTGSTADYRAESDALRRFIDEMCVVGECATVRARKLYLAYRRWAEDGGEEVMTETAFGNRLTQAGFTKRHDNRGKVYNGIGLRAGDDSREE